MSKTDGVHLGFEVEVVQGDALQFEADVLALKDMPDLPTFEAKIVSNLKKTGRPYKTGFPTSSDWSLWYGNGLVRARLILVVEAKGSVFSLNYQRVQQLGRRFLQALSETGDEVSHLATITHGAGIGVDQAEVFRALLLGMADAYQSGQYPQSLKKITIVERDEHRARLFQSVLRLFLQPAPAAAPPAAPPPAPSAAPETSAREEAPASEKKKEKEAARGLDEESAPAAAPLAAAVDLTPVEMAVHPQPVAVIAGPESFAPEFRKPTADESTPHVFVAMPFRDKYDDQFYLAIMPAVRGMSLLCERMDLDTFTGEITDRMFKRIETARLVIALLDGSNPNVYLEIGYAWGVRTPTVLIAHKEEPLPFDVRGHRVLIYDKIYLLKEMLEAELKRLLR